MEFGKKGAYGIWGKAMERKVLHGIKASELYAQASSGVRLSMKFCMCRKRYELTKNYQGALKTSVRAYRVGELLDQSSRVESSCYTPKHFRKTLE